jgi:hypothetical protein
VAVIARHASGLGSLRMPFVAALVFCAALAALAWGRADVGPSGRPSDSAVHAAAFSDPAARAHLARLGFDEVRTTPLDGHSTRVSFFNGSRIVLEAAVSRDTRVTNLIRYDDRYVRLGSEVGQRVPVLIALVALFLLATLRLPLRRLGNLDALALAAFVVPVVLMNERYLDWSVLSATALLAYLAMRCAMSALGGPTPRGGETWLIGHAPRWAIRLGVGAAAVALVLLSIPGGLISDVAFASMAGATDLLHGTLPYGHLSQSELVHGDTYPLLAYLAYVPAAVLGPVRDAFDGGLDGALYVSTGFALLAALALARVAGGRVALAFLAFPPVMIAASSGSNDVVAAAFIALALVAGAHAGRSSGALAAAGWVKLAPFALLPLWVARYRSWRVVTAAAATAALVAAFVWALGGTAGFADMVEAVSFQAERGSLLSPWTLLGAGGAQLVFQAAVVAALALAAMRVWRDRALAADPHRMAALGAAIMLAVQLAANYWSYTYLAWVFPLVAVGLLTRSPARAPAQ